jgi:group I intron endonuclease
MVDIFSIYCITNVKNHKKYVGWTTAKDPKRRWYGHVKNSKEGSQCLIHKAMRKYGIDVFDFQVVFQSSNKTFIQKIMEPYFILSENSHYITGWGYNMTYGGEGTTGLRWSKSQRIAKSKSQLGEKNHNFGKEPYNKGNKWYNNGKEQIFCLPGEQPKGFTQGRLPVKESTKKLISSKRQGKEPWNKGLTLSTNQKKNMGRPRKS